jgi:hypothetical protein
MLLGGIRATPFREHVSEAVGMAGLLLNLVMGKTTGKVFAWLRRRRVALIYRFKLWLAGGGAKKTVASVLPARSVWPGLSQDDGPGFDPPGGRQGLTLVHFSAQLEPCLTQENTLHTLNNP